MTDLSPQARAVLDAVGDLYESDIPEDRDIMIATLRAAALYCKRDRLQLFAIAEELEGKQ